MTTQKIVLAYRNEEPYRTGLYDYRGRWIEASISAAIGGAIAAELVGNVATLWSAYSADALQVHKYTPQALNKFEGDGRAHLAVWPAQPFSEVTDPYQTGSHNHQETYSVLYWEASAEGDTAEADEAKAATLLTLADNIIGRFYATANQTLASNFGQWRLWLRSWTPALGGLSGLRGLSFTLDANVLYNMT